MARAYGKSSFVYFLGQFYDDEEEDELDAGDGLDADGKPIKFEYHVMDYNDQGEEIGIRETITDPLTLLVLRELRGLESLHMEKKKLLKLYEMAKEMFEVHCDAPALVWEYENKRMDLLQRIQASRPKRFMDEVIQNSATRLQ